MPNFIINAVGFIFMRLLGRPFQIFGAQSAALILTPGKKIFSPKQMAEVLLQKLVPESENSLVHFAAQYLSLACQDRSSPKHIRRTLLELFSRNPKTAPDAMKSFPGVWRELCLVEPLATLIVHYRKKFGFEGDDASRDAELFYNDETLASSFGELDGANFDEDEAVPLEEPVQIDISTLNLHPPLHPLILADENELGGGGKIGSSMEHLASDRRFVPSQVDYGKLVRTMERRKQRAEKRAGNASAGGSRRPGDRKKQAEEAERERKAAMEAAILEDLLSTAGSSEFDATETTEDFEGERKRSRDIKIEAFDISIASKRILTEASMAIAFGRRYGLVGRNGVGKSTLLRYLSSRQISGASGEIPAHLSILHVEQEVQGGDISVIDSVLAADFRRELLIREERRLNDLLQAHEQQQLQPTTNSKPSQCSSQIKGKKAPDDDVDEDRINSRLQACHRKLAEMDADSATSK